MKIKNMKKSDLIFVNEVRNDYSTRKNLKNSKKISLESTIEWFETKKPKWKIIEVNNEKVGYLRTSSDTGESICIGCDIAPQHRRKGYAKLAYEKYLKSLYELGYIVIWLEVFDDNLPARKLYQNLNFLDVGCRIVNNKKYIAMVHGKLDEI